MNSESSLIFALDVDNLDEACSLAEQTAGSVGCCKTGLELICAAGPPAIAKRIENAFMDIKLPDIPETCMKSAKVLADLGVYAFNMHAYAGPKAIEATANVKGRSKLLAVTLLTSLTVEQIWEMGLPKCWPGAKNIEDVTPADREKYLQEVVLHMSMLAQSHGADGIICSPKEVPLLRGSGWIGNMMEIWTPAIRPLWAVPNDQNPDRVMTPAKAKKAGVTRPIVGRPIKDQYKLGGFSSPAEAAQSIMEEFAAA